MRGCGVGVRMAKVGLFVNLNERVSDNATVEKVRRSVLKRFEVDSSHRVDVFRMVPLRPHEPVTPADMLAVVDQHQDYKFLGL